MRKLESIVLRDVHPFYGGMNLWLARDGVAVVQMVSGGQEQRYESRFSQREPRAAEFLVTQFDLSSLVLPQRMLVPDEGCAEISVRWDDGEGFTARKRERDQAPEFDTVHTFLMALARNAVHGKLVFAGPYESAFHP